MDRKLPIRGSTSRFYELSQDVILKSPADQPTRADIIAAEFNVERQLLETLGHHPRIVGSVPALNPPPRFLHFVLTIFQLFWMAK